MKQEQKIRYGLYHKFATIIILVGIFPMIGLTTFIANRIIQEYYEAMENQYEQTTDYVAKSLVNMLESYNSVSTLPYYYNSNGEGSRLYLSYDNFRKMIMGEKYASSTWENERNSDMTTFLQYIGSTDPEINAVHFVANVDGKILGFHNSTYSTYFRDEFLFFQAVRYDLLDKQSNQLLLIPTHSMKYYGEISDLVFTIGRNYFDLRGEIGERTYVGTLYMDINVHKIERIIQSVDFDKGEVIFITNENGDCLYSNQSDYISKNVSVELASGIKSEDLLVISSDLKDYGLHVTVMMETENAFHNIRELQRIMYMMLVLSILLVLFGSAYFSKKLTDPIRKMMQQMEQVENGEFDLELDTDSKDEIGLLSKRFNKMSYTLKSYIAQSYLAQMKQTEAELSALKSQIYPYFLYNTLEIIRMSALDEENRKVPEMIEALSEQIHYLIGPVRDVVSLEKEIDITRKYIYLLNCRIDHEIVFLVNAPGSERVKIPRLIIQPIVENAYIHGIKETGGGGVISIETERQDTLFVITVMDNGVGMDEKEVAELRLFLEGDQPGKRNHEDWQSIGLKNVHDRIRYLYGEEYGIEITSTLGIGTMVRINVPYLDGGDQNVKNDISR